MKKLYFKILNFFCKNYISALKIQKDEMIIIRFKDSDYDELINYAMTWAETLSKDNGPDVILVNNETMVYVQKKIK